MEDVALSKCTSISSAPELARKPAVAVQLFILASLLERRVFPSRQGADQGQGPVRLGSICPSVFLTSSTLLPSLSFSAPLLSYPCTSPVDLHAPMQYFNNMLSELICVQAGFMNVSALYSHSFSASLRS